MNVKSDLATEAENILNISLILVGDRYIYRADETDEWFWVSRSDMRYAIILAQDDDEEIRTSLYSHWCASAGKQVSWRFARTLDIDHGYVR